MRRLPRATWIAVSVTGILAILLSLLGNVGATALTWLSPPLALVLFVLISLALIAFSLWQEGQKSASEPSEAEAREYRRIMLARVQYKWITGFLENKLYYDEEHLPSPLRKRVGSHFDLVLSDPLKPTHPISSGTTITQVFDQAGGELLILGEPGAGKTTLLLELARDLLKRAKGDEEGPIPVVLTLSSWAAKQLSLNKWIVEELRMKYDVRSQIGEEWVKANQLLLLLDGLDEVTPDALPACIEAINEYYHQAHRHLVVCSRTKEFLDQPGRLALHTAVMVQPLSSEQVDIYLDGLAAKGEEIEGLKRALHQSAKLSALATTPLFLTVLILAYHGKPARELLALVKAAPIDQPHLLLHNYVEQMLQRKGTHLHAPAQQTKHWLTWLARQLTAHQQSELYLERLQPDWLPKGRRALYYWSVGLVGGLFYGLVSGLVIGLFYGLRAGLLSGLSYGLVGVLLSGVSLLDEKEINLAEVLTWSWKELTVELLEGLVGGLLYGLVIGLFYGLRAGLLSGLVIGLVYWLTGRLGRRLEIKERTKYYIRVSRDQALLHRESATGGRRASGKEEFSPNESMRHSVKNGLLIPVGALVIGLVVGLVIGLLAQQAKAPPVFVLFRWPISLQQINTPALGLSLGLVGGLLYGLVSGLGAVVKHYILRFWLSRSRTFPWNMVSFLDDVVEQQLLRKVGGGYIFRHRLLQDYFASLDVVPPHDLSVRAEARSILPNVLNGDPSL